MATYPQHTAVDPRFFNTGTISLILDNVKKQLSSSAPGEVDRVQRKDVVGMMYRVWRPHAGVDYMVRVTSSILVQNILEDLQIEMTNINNMLYNSIHRGIHDPHSVIKASYKYPSSGISSRPVIDLSY